MARNLKSGLDYFPFSTGFFDDDKIKCIGGEFGIKGEIIAIRLLCTIYRENGYFAVWDEKLRAMLARQMSGVSVDLIEQVVNRLVKWGFFLESLFNSDKILTSSAIQRRYFEATKRRQQPRDLPFLVLPQNELMYTKTSINVCKNAENVNRNPINKIKVKISPDGDTKKPPSPPPSFDIFLAEVLNSLSWLEAIAKNLQCDVDAVRSLLKDDFRGHCLREGKQHRDIGDFKSHFNRWSSQRKYSSTNNVTTSITQQHNDRATRQQEFARHIASQLATPYTEPDVSGDY